MEKYGTEKAVSDEIRRQEEKIAQLRKQASFTPDEEKQYMALRRARTTFNPVGAR